VSRANQVPVLNLLLEWCQIGVWGKSSTGTQLTPRMVSDRCAGQIKYRYTTYS